MMVDGKMTLLALMGSQFSGLRVDYEVDDFEIIWQSYDNDLFFIILEYYWKIF